MLYTLLVIVWYALCVVGAWKMFEKAGEPGWKSLIPVYNMYICFKFCWNTTYFWVWLVLVLISSWVSAYTIGTDGMFATTFTGIAMYIISLVTMLITVNLAYHLSMSFGHGFWYALGLTFFPFIFTIIIGFGDSRYIGNTQNLIHA